MVRKSYPPEFMSQTVHLVMRKPDTCAQAGQRLETPRKTLANGVRPHRKPQRQEQVAEGRKNDDSAAHKARIAELENNSAKRR